MRLFLLPAILLSSLFSNAQTYYLFAGTYTNGDSKGIYVYKFNTATGEVTSVGTTASGPYASPRTPTASFSFQRIVKLRRSIVALRGVL